MQKTSFFSMSELKQPVNQWICIAFLGVWCFWFLLYYVSKKAEIVGTNLTTASFTQVLTE